MILKLSVYAYFVSATSSKVLTLSNSIKFQTIDSHNINFLNWIAPVHNIKDDYIDLFIYNEHGGEYNINVIFDGEIHKFTCPGKSYWSLFKINNIKEGEDESQYIFESVISYDGLYYETDVILNDTYNEDNSISFTAIKQINKGDEITWSYSDNKSNFLFITYFNSCLNSIKCFFIN